MLVGFVGALCLLGLVGRYLPLAPSRGEGGQLVKVDTLTVTRVDTVWMKVTESKTVTRWDTVYADTVTVGEIADLKFDDLRLADGDLVAVRRYIDSVAINNAMLHYNLAVIGELYRADFRLVSHVPRIDRTVTQTITKEVMKYPAGVYGTVAFNTGAGPAVGGMYLKKRWMVGYEYGLNKTHSARVGMRIF